MREAVAPGGTGRVEDSDVELIRRVRAGDRQAEEALMRRHHRTVYNLAYRLSRNPEEAEDIVQEAFIRVHNALPNFRGDANFSTWLFRIVRNVFLDERKKQRVRQHSSLEEIVELEDSQVSRQVEDPHPGPGAVVERRELSALVQDAVLELPELPRLMIVLYHFHHRSYEEIAAILDLPIGTVKSRLNRARAALRSRLAGSRELLEE